MAKKSNPLTTVYLVRHGRTPSTGKILPGRAKGLHLSDVGQAQAEVAASRLGEMTSNVEAIYASPLERARQTAAPISRELGFKTIIEKGLNECEFGDWTGRSLSELSRLPEWKTVQHAPSTFRFPNGESFPEMQARITGAIAKLVGQHVGASFVAVSHADPIKAVVASAMGVPLDMFQRTSISPCSITVIAYGVGGPSVLAVNSVPSLKELSPS